MICDEWIDSLSLKALLTALSIWLLATNVIVEYFKCRNKEILTTKPILEKGSFVELLLWRPDDFFTELKHFPPTCQPKETRKRENRLNLPNRRKNYARKSHLTLSSHNFHFDCGRGKCRAGRLEEGESSVDARILTFVTTYIQGCLWRGCSL